MTQEVKWCPAIYARLSKEDKKGVSVSIEHQIDILKGYVAEKGWQIPKVYYDDDRTGTNFDRKGFKDMYAAAERGEINVIVIKDTSRFGRNWVQSGMYFEKIEEMGVRFISIQEGLDTADPQCPALKMLPFYFVFNEWHSQTTSEKIKTVFRKQDEKGLFRANQPPYGYEKSPDDKHRLVIDPYAASIVRQIFDMRLQKVSVRSIVTTLNKEGISSPSHYYAEKVGKPGKKGRLNKWSPRTVRSMLDNPVYRGDIATGKRRTISYKNQKAVPQPFENWHIARDTHEPIVSREAWQEVFDINAKLGRVRCAKTGETAPFSGLIMCEDCNVKMMRNNFRYKVKGNDNKVLHSYNCRTYREKGKAACSSHFITESVLMELVIADIREKTADILLDENAAKKRFREIKTRSTGTQLKHDKSALKKINKRLDELEKLLQVAFEKSVLSGSSTDIFSAYAKKYEEEKQELMSQAEELSKSIVRQSETENDVETFIALLKKHAKITEPDRETIVELIERVTVTAITSKPRGISIYYKHIGFMRA
ncbi:MAG: recombinase family protein [Defluviitaleaceae bacterium]|nr:recombinase family protein [Defluviitaleaceae bacterium]